jgi:hypothetical protein
MKYLIILTVFLFVSCQSKAPTSYSVETVECTEIVYQYVTDTIYETKFLTTNKTITKCPDFMQEEIDNLNKEIAEKDEIIYNLKFTQKKLITFAPSEYQKMINNEN